MIACESQRTDFLPSGPWTGFYTESHRTQRGWMHLYLQFDFSGDAVTGSVRGEGTDYVGPWTLIGAVDLNAGSCQWTKRYVGKHRVEYAGLVGSDGITGRWQIGHGFQGDFHIWPNDRSDLQENYLKADLEIESSSPLGTVPRYPRGTI